MADGGFGTQQNYDVRRGQMLSYVMPLLRVPQPNKNPNHQPPRYTPCGLLEKLALMHRLVVGFCRNCFYQLTCATG